MSRSTQSIIVALLGGFLIKITVTGRFMYYVKPGFGPLLLIAGVLLVLIGLLVLGGIVVSVLRADGAETHISAEASGAGAETALLGDPATGDAGPVGEHDHQRSKAPWLILAPLLVLVLAAPPALGADAVISNAGSQAIAGPGTTGSGTGATGGSAGNRRTMSFGQLPAGPNPPMSLQEFVLRALYDAEPSVSSHSITVVGFIGYPSYGFADGYSIARMVISCCAADATPILVHVDGAAPYPPDTWVSAVISANQVSASEANLYVPTVTVASIQPTTEPADPYLH